MCPFYSIQAVLCSIGSRHERQKGLANLKVKYEVKHGMYINHTGASTYVNVELLQLVNLF